MNLYSNSENIMIDVISKKYRINYNGSLPFTVNGNGFHLRGDAEVGLGREAYISWCRGAFLEGRTGLAEL